MQINRRTKQCSRCGVWKSKKEFGKTKKNKDGFKSFCRSCHNNYNSEWSKQHKEKVRPIVKKYYAKLKLSIFIAYGGNPPKCACCGETHIEFLTLDHINGGGSKERNNRKQGSYGIYRRLKREGFPKGFRVLCMNCNWAYGKWGYCPHKKELKISK